MLQTITQLLTPTHIIATLGVVGVIAIVFAESGLFFGFFLPGDSLLFTAGFLAFVGVPPLSLPVLLVGAFVAAVAGDIVGFTFGKRVGKALYNRPDSKFFKQAHVTRAHDFYEKYGAKAIVLARFIPIVRTFAPIVAGVAGMNYRRFISYNIVGGLLWSFGMILLGYFFGQIIPNPDRYVTPVILGIIVVSFLPAVIPWISKRLKL